jgi:GT2 family glycosyltransferase
MYYEDADFSQRVKSLGYRVFYVPGGGIWHFNAGSSEVGGDLQDYFISRNRLLFGLKWAPLRTKVALIRESVRLWQTGRKWQKIGVKDFYLRKFGRGSWQ